MEDVINEICKIVKESNNIVFFGGAGISTESGIPDFRSVDGLYNLKYKYPPETMLSDTFFATHPDEFYEFYKDKCLRPMLKAEPCITHKALAYLEKIGKLKAIVTQNIDDLHHRAGSKVIYELHGTSFKNYCQKCHKAFTVEDILKSDGVPHCDCGGIIKPDVVLYGEQLNYETISKATTAIEDADVLIIAGTTLVVQPAASYINYYRGNKMILINLSSVPNEESIDYVVHEKAGVVFERILNYIK